MPNQTSGSVAHRSPEEQNEGAPANALAEKWQLRKLRDALAERGHIPGHKLSPRAFVILLNAYSKDPGRDARYRRTLIRDVGDCEHPRELECHCAQKAKKAQNELRAVGVYDWTIIKAHHALPWRSAEGFRVHLHNQICHVQITKAHVEQLARLLGVTLTKPVLDLKKTPSTGFNKTPSTRSRSPSLREGDLNHHHLEGPPSASHEPAAASEKKTGSADSPPRRFAPRPPSGGQDGHKQDSAKDVPPEMARVLAAWKKTKLAPPAYNRAPAVLRIRHAQLVQWQGMTDEAAWTYLEDAARGALEPAEYRYLSSKKTLCPFAVVFSRDLDRLAEFAHHGRKLRALDDADATARERKRAEAARAEAEAAADERRHRAMMARESASDAAKLAAESLGLAPPASPAREMTPDEQRARVRAQLDAARDLDRAWSSGSTGVRDDGGAE